MLFPDPLVSGDERCWPDFDSVPEGQDVFEAIRFLRGLSEADVDDEVGFVHVIDAETRTILFEADVYGNPDQLGFLLHRFLHEFRPAECLAFTWAATCDRLRPDAFDGGAMLARASGWTGMTGGEWAERQRRLFTLSGGRTSGEHAEFPRDDWRSEVTADETSLGYWDWVLARLEDPCECEQPGPFDSGVPGVLAPLVDGRVPPDGVVERCDACEPFPDDAAARRKLVELGLAGSQERSPQTDSPFPVTLVLSGERGIDFDATTITSETALSTCVENAIALNRELTIRVVPKPATDNSNREPV